MKKILVSMFLLVFGLCLVGCDLAENDKNVTCKKYENCAIFTFDEFSVNETISFKLDRTRLGEGTIYYQVNLVAGALSINYQDRWHDIVLPLGEFSADDEKNINGSGGYVEGDKVTIIFESDSVVSGEIIIAFTEESLNSVQGNLQKHEHNYIEGLCDCGEFDSVWLNVNFRLSDEQILFKGSVDDEFNCDIILLTLKHTTTYIELSKKHFKLDEITEVVYISSTPPSHFYEPGNEDKLNNFHQIVFLYVDVETKEEIIELIIELEKLPFVESVGPNSIEYGE
jgi:hypothetical protein